MYVSPTKVKENQIHMFLYYVVVDVITNEMEVSISYSLVEKTYLNKRSSVCKPN